MKIPGFVDLQVNGYAGIDLSNPDTTANEELEMAQQLAAQGTAGFLATIVTAPPEVMEHCVATVAEAIRRQEGPRRILGIHLEGPFISPEYGYRGAHQQANVREPDLAWFEHLQTVSEGSIRMVTLAPESRGARHFIRAVAGEVIVSAGHTNCSYDTVVRAAREGLSMVTHIGNGCPPTIHRHHNPIMNSLACQDLSLSFIADGFHLPEPFIRLLFACRPVNKLLAVSDSTSLAGLGPGEYVSGGRSVVLRKDGRLSLASDDCLLAGSSFTLYRCMNFLASLEILTESDLWQIAYFNPLKLLGLEQEDLGEGAGGVQYDRPYKRFTLSF